MARFPAQGVKYSIGPGPLTPAVRAIIFANLAVFVVSWAAPALVVDLFGLAPEAVLTEGRIWQPVTYLFVHLDLMHGLFNMLAVWMFGVELERRWGTPAFAKYYFVTGVGAGLCMLLLSLAPFEATRGSYDASTIGASGAVYGLMLAWALIFPHRTVLFLFVFPLPARVFVLIMGAISFYYATAAGGGTTVSHVAHLGGLLVGWLYLKGPSDPGGTLRYHVTRWRMARLRKRFGVHQGGRPTDPPYRVH